MSVSCPVCKMGERFLTHRRAGKIKQGSTVPLLPVSLGTTQAEGVGEGGTGKVSRRTGLDPHSREQRAGRWSREKQSFLRGPERRRHLLPSHPTFFKDAIAKVLGDPKSLPAVLNLEAWNLFNPPDRPGLFQFSITLILCCTFKPERVLLNIRTLHHQHVQGCLGPVQLLKMNCNLSVRLFHPKPKVSQFTQCGRPAPPTGRQRG